MHFRLRGNNVQLVKSLPDAQLGRAKPTLVGSANLITGQLNERAEAALSDAEKAEVAKWLEKRRDFERKKAEVEILGLPDTLALAVQRLPEMEPEQARELVAELIAALQNIRRVASRHGLI
ncbi:hypothetical protein SAMN05421644_13912 [Allochromatium warmingii]|uniref:Uncharacterized protein n=1 Tax=Allochromatium warmingii TaxID=61595 RepID=A0A1H3I458_ALLWA|nr:hypothetical protein [Allochromatium warmingii]SDY21834.1 hypothetical protein SAMN05421644_13912 [Allochromatium warmingii]